METVEAERLEEVTANIWYDPEEDYYHVYTLWVKPGGNSIEHTCYNYEEAAQAFIDAAECALKTYGGSGIGKVDFIDPFTYEFSTKQPAAAIICPAASGRVYIDEPCAPPSKPSKKSSRKISRRTRNSREGKVKGAST